MNWDFVFAPRTFIDRCKPLVCVFASALSLLVLFNWTNNPYYAFAADNFAFDADFFYG